MVFFQAGDEVIHGNDFQTTDQTLLNQILIERNKTTTPACSIVYIYTVSLICATELLI